MMNPAEFANIARAERDFWWYRGMQEILFRVLDPLARVRRFEQVGEAGCGTGYLSQVLAKRYGWNMFPLDYGWEGVEIAKSNGVPRVVQGDLTALPYRSGSIDLLVLIRRIAHLASGVAPTAPWLDRMLYRPLAMEARWIGRGVNLPLGQSLLMIAGKPW